MNILLATLLFYTRIPIGKTRVVPKCYFKSIVQFWPIAGWITAPITALILLIAQWFFPFPIAVLLAILARVILTGALHEDGLSDWADGFFGGHTKEKILMIMKDSYTGTFGILSLIFYFSLLFLLLSQLPLNIALPLILIGDPLAKGISSLMPFFLTYVRPIEESKYKTELINHVSWLPIVAFFTLLPYALFTFLWLTPIYYLAIISPIIVFFLFKHWLYFKIGGYTGDTLGALVLLLELSFYLTGVAIFHSL